MWLLPQPLLRQTGFFEASALLVGVDGVDTDEEEPDEPVLLR